MSSGFVSAGTTEAPIERSAEWLAAQAEIEEKHRLKAEAAKQHNGKSLFEVLQANKEAKQEAFEEAARLKNQYRALNDDEAEYLEEVLQGGRRKEEEVRKETLEQLGAFRRRQEEAERRALEGEAEREGKAGGEGTGVEGGWIKQGGGRKRKVGRELLKGVKIRRGSGVAEDKKGEDVAAQKMEGTKTVYMVSKETPAAKAVPAETPSTSPPAKTANALALGLGYASSDEGD